LPSVQEVFMLAVPEPFWTKLIPLKLNPVELTNDALPPVMMIVAVLAVTVRPVVTLVSHPVELATVHDVLPSVRVLVLVLSDVRPSWISFVH
jgi:hypothetical protein